MIHEDGSGLVNFHNKEYVFSLSSDILNVEGLGTYDFETERAEPRILKEDGDPMDSIDLDTDCARGALFLGYHHCCTDCRNWYEARDNLKSLAFELNNGARRRSNWKFNVAGVVAEGGVD